MATKRTPFNTWISRLFGRNWPPIHLIASVLIFPEAVIVQCSKEGNSAEDRSEQLIGGHHFRLVVVAPFDHFKAYVFFTQRLDNSCTLGFYDVKVLPLNSIPTTQLPSRKHYIHVSADSGRVGCNLLCDRLILPCQEFRLPSLFAGAMPMKLAPMNR
jgi:hypothetical protein